MTPAAAQEQEDSGHPEDQHGRGAAKAALDMRADAEVNRASPALQAQPREDRRPDRIQHQPPSRSAGRGFDYSDAPESRQQMPSVLEQQERANQAAQRESRMRLRGDERQRGEGMERTRAQQRDLVLRQQRGIDEPEDAQRRQQEPTEDRGQRWDNERERSPLLRDHDRRQPLRGSDDRRGVQVQDRLDRAHQERRIAEERQRAQRYHRQHDGYHHLADQRARMLQQQRRMAQYHYQQQYYQRLRQQQARWDSRRYDHYSDPYYYTPASYRYSYGGRWHQTNRYGADLMRQAVDYGYREGLRAGRADRQDQWRSDYRNSYAYQDASYGYNGYYVGHDIYSHYFRQGFERGYQDAYSDRYRYGRRNSDGEYGVIAAVVTAILGLQLLR